MKNNVKSNTRCNTGGNTRGVICICVAMLVMLCLMSSCIKPKIRVHDTKTGCTVVLDEDQGLILEGLDTGRFKIDTEVTE